MYIPPAFAETNLDTLHDFIEWNSFGLLVSQAEGQPIATHLPFLLDRHSGVRGTLMGHVARANPHWQNLTAQTILAIFSGPHAYISPTWHQADEVVPTWNYAVAHVYGRAEIVDDENGLLDLVKRSVRKFEQGTPRPWGGDGSPAFVKRMLAQIVGFRIAIDRIEGKWKLNQNHPVARRQRVIRALEQKGDENALAVARMMQDKLTAEK